MLHVVYGQRGAQTVVQPAAFNACFVLFVHFGRGVEGGAVGCSVDAQIAAAAAVGRIGFVKTGIQGVLRVYIPYYAQIRAEMVPFIAAAAVADVDGAEAELFVAAACCDFQLRGGGENVLYEQAVGFSFMAVADGGGGEAAGRFPAFIACVGIDVVVAAGADGGVAPFFAVIVADGQVVVETADFEFAVEREGVAERGVVGLLPGVVLVEQAPCGVVAAAVKVVEILAGFAAGKLPLQLPVVVEIEAQVGAPGLQPVGGKIAGMGEAFAVADAHLVVNRFAWVAVGNTLGVVVQILPRPAQFVCAHGDAGRNHAVFAVGTVAEAVVFADFAHQTDGNMIVNGLVQIDIAVSGAVAAVQQPDIAAGVEIGIFADHVDDAAAVTAAVEHGAGAFQDFHALDVGGAAAHLTAFAHAVAVDVVGIGLEAPDVDAFAAHVVGGVDTGIAFQNRAQIIGAVVFVFLDVQNVDGLRNFLDRQSVARSRRFAVVDIAFQYAAV